MQMTSMTVNTFYLMIYTTADRLYVIWPRAVTLNYTTDY